MKKSLYFLPPPKSSFHLPALFFSWGFSCDLSLESGDAVGVPEAEQ